MKNKKLTTEHLNNNLRAATATRCHLKITWYNGKIEKFIIPGTRRMSVRDKVNRVCGL